MEPRPKRKRQSPKHGCCSSEFCQKVESVNGIVSNEKQYVGSSNLLKNFETSKQFSITTYDEDSNDSPQIADQEENNQNEGQRPHANEVLPTDNQCGVCNKIFDSQQLLIIHAIDDHPFDKAFKCIDCGEAFSKIGALIRHRKIHEDVPKNNVCDICFKVFRSNYHMLRHLKSHNEKSSYACSLCEKICKNQYLLNSHEKCHLKSETYKYSCEFCSIPFDSLNNLKMHLRIEHNAERVRIKCSKKSQTTSTSKSQNRVKKLLLKAAKVKKHFCTYCSKSFLRKDLLKRHLMIHSEVRPTYPCSICNKSYKDKRDLRHHQKIHLQQELKSNDKNYKTMDVSKQFEDYILPHSPISLKLKDEVIINEDIDSIELAEKTKSNIKYIYKEEAVKPRSKSIENNSILNEDTSFENVTIAECDKNVNENEIAYECAVCDEIFKFERDFIKHVKQLHHNSKAFKCRCCSKSFLNASALANHIKTHDDKNKLICGFCSKSFTCISYLNNHLEVHSTERPYTCAFCDKSYKYKRDLKTHEKKKHMGKSGVMKKCHVCKFCSKTFDRPSHLDRHLKVHSRKRTLSCHVCKFCSKTFDRSSHLDRHLKVHSSKRPFSCSSCGKTFKHNINLKTHQNRCLENTVEKSMQDMKILKTVDVEQERKITFKKEVNKETSSVKEGPLDKDHLNKLCKNNTNDSRNIQDIVEIISDTDDDDFNGFDEGNDFDGRNMIEIFKTENLYEEAVQPITKIQSQQNPFTDQDNIMINKSSRRKINGVKRQIHTTNKCAVCNKIFKFQRDLIKHAQEYHSSDKPLKCRYCKQRFSSIQTLLRHSRIHKELTEKHRCEFCLKNFSTKGNLKIHLVKHYEDVYEKSFYKNIKHLKQLSKNAKDDLVDATTDKVQKDKVHICEICSKSFPTMYRLNLHLTSHTVGRPLVCSFCEKTFKHKSNLVYHEKSHMGFEKKFTCDICFKSFRSKSMLARHFKYHTNERRFSCFQCKKTYKHKVDLKKHQKICLQLNSCSLCEKIFADSKSLRNHLEMHYVNKCAVCDKMCNSQRDLVRHARQFHPKSKAFKCQTCSKVLSNKTALNIHKKVCLQLKTCSYCERIMPDDDNFKRHLMMHYVNKCAVCEKVCKSQKDLIDHAQQFHPSGHAFKCPVCDKLYSSKTPFNCHTKTHKDKLNRDFYMFLYEKKYEQNIDYEFLKLLEESESNTKALDINQTIINSPTQQINETQNERNSNEANQEFVSIINDQINDTQNDLNSYEANYAVPLTDQIIETENLPKSYEAEFDTMTTEYLSDIEYVEEEVSPDYQEDHVIKSLDIEILYNKPQEEDNLDMGILYNKPQEEDNLDMGILYNKPQEEDNLEVKIKVDTEFIDVETIVQPVENLEDNYIKMEPKEEFIVESLPPAAVVPIIYKPILVKKKILTDNKCAICHKMFKFQRDLIKHAQHYHRNAKAFECHRCGAQFSAIQAVSLHNKIYHTPEMKKKRLPCKTCSKSFTCQDDLNRHLKSHLPDPLAMKYPPKAIQTTNPPSAGDPKRTHICEICSKGFANKYRLNRHLKAHTVERPYSCSLCGNNYKHEYTLREHELTHLDFSNSQHACTLCLQTFSCASRLNRHLVVHTKECPFACSICGKKFKHLHNMKVHETKHLGLDLVEKTHVCEICCEAFAAEAHLKRHMGVHTGERPYVCTKCEKVFKNKNGLNKHLQGHLRDNLNEQDITEITQQLNKPTIRKKRIPKNITKLQSQQNPSEYKCAVCDKVFNFRRDLIQHAKEFHQSAKAFKCSDCDRVFLNTQALASHTRTHTISLKDNDNANTCEKENKNIYMCEFCSKSFICMSSLQRHFKSHQVERPYSCSLCNKTYKDLNDLKMHKQKTHEKTNTCEYCFKTFCRSDNLFRHLKLHDTNQCVICFTMCSSKLDLAKHAKEFHPKGKVFKCQICGVLMGSRTTLKRHLANHKEDHLYSTGAYKHDNNLNESNLYENDLQELTSTNIIEDIDVVGTTDDNQVVTNTYETNEEIIVVDDFDQTEEFYHNIEDENVVEETVNTINSTDVIEDLFIRIVTP